MFTTSSTPFADLLRQHRLAAGLTQEALAERAGLSVHGIQKLERGATRPYRDTSSRLMDALGLTGEARSQFEAAAAPGPRRRTAGTLPRREVILYHAPEDGPAVEYVAAHLRNAGLSPRTESSLVHDHENGAQAAVEWSGSTPCAVFVSSAGLSNWDAGPLGIALRTPDRTGVPRLIPVLLPGAPDPFAAAALPPVLQTQPWVDFRASLDNPRALAELVSAIRGAPVTQTDWPQALVELVCPYRGLESFEQEHADLFFGREADVQRLLEHLKASRFVSVVAPSGSGKSSLVRAGLLPALRRGALPGSAAWQPLLMLPGAEPLTALATELLTLSPGGAIQPTLDSLATDARTLHLAVSLALARQSRTARVVLVIDQFEELFTQCWDPLEQAQFVANLLYAATVPDGRTVVLVTMRADFYAHCTAYPELAAAMAAHQHLLSPMDDERLRQVIEGPARRTGLSFDPGLVDSILDDVAGEPGALPLLEYALTELWNHRRGSLLTLEGYHTTGGVHGALALRAEQVYAAFSPTEQAVAQQVFLRLVEAGDGTEDSRRRVDLSELITVSAGREIIQSVVGALVAARLLTASGDSQTGTASVEVAHEALIRNWPRLRAWLDENRADLRLHRRLMESAREWQRLGRDDGALYRAGVLAEALELRARKQTGLNELENEFLDACVALQNRERRARSRVRRLALLTLGGGLLLAIVLGGLAAVQWQRAERERGVALGRELAFEADAARKGAGVLLPRSALLAAESLSRFPPRDSEPALRQDLALLARPLLSLAQTGQHPTAAYSPDGQYLATGDGSGDAAVWAVADGHRVSTLPVGSPVKAIAWSRDAKVLATASNDGSVRIWDPASGAGLERFDEPDAVYALAFSPDGGKLAAASMDGNSRIWDRGTHAALLLPTNATVVDRFSPDGGNEFAESLAQSMAYSPDGRQLATARTSDNVAHVWDAQSGTELLRLQHDGVVLAVAFSPDGQYIATGSADGSTRIWSRDGTQVGRTTTNRSSPTFTVAFSPDSHYLATGGFSFAGQVVDVPNGKDVVSLQMDDSAQSLAWSPDGTEVAAASNDGTARIWALNGGHEITRMPIGFDVVVHQVQFSPDGTQLVTASADGVVRTWQATTAWQDVGLNHPDTVIAVAYSPDGHYLASSAGTTAYIWDAHTGVQLQQLAHPALAWALHFSSDGRYLATSSFDGYGRIWDVATGQEVKRFLHGDRERVYGVRFSPDGTLLATAGLKGGVKVWNIATGVPIMQVTHDSAAGYLRFTPDGKYLISGSVDHTARVWDLANGREVRRMAADSPLYELDISPDGRYLAGGDDHDARIWDVATGAQVLLLGHPTGVNGVAFSADGKYLATAAKDGVARVWLVSSGEQVAGMAHDKSLNGLAFSPDVSYLATASSDQTVRLWTPLLADPIGAACQHVISNLTRDEWQQYLPGETYHLTCPGRG